MDRISIMQKNIEKRIKKRMQSQDLNSTRQTSSRGLLSPRGTTDKDKTAGASPASFQERTLDVIADYIVDIRKQKEEILNAKTNID